MTTCVSLLSPVTASRHHVSVSQVTHAAVVVVVVVVVVAVVAVAAAVMMTMTVVVVAVAVVCGRWPVVRWRRDRCPSTACPLPATHDPPDPDPDDYGCYSHECSQCCRHSVVLVLVRQRWC